MTSYLSGVSPDCIRAWERRYGAIVPERDKGRRVFDDNDVTRLLMLKELSLIGNPISTVAKLSNEELTKLCLEVGINPTVKNGSELIVIREASEFIEVITLAFENKRFDILHHELTKASDELSGTDFVNGIMISLLERFKKSIHTDIQRKTLLTLFKSIMLKKIVSKGDTRAVVGYFPGELNELKCLMSAMIMSQSGMNITFAGECDDVDVIINIARITEARLIAMESSSVSQHNLTQFREKVESLLWKGEFIFVDALNPLEGKLKNS